MKKIFLLLLPLLAAASLARAADPYLLGDLPLGSSTAKARSVVGAWTEVAAPEGLRAFTVAGPVRQARDLRLIFQNDALISLSFRTPGDTFAAVRIALAKACGAFAPKEDGHLAYEARRGGKLLQLLRQDDGGAWVVWMAEDKIPPELKRGQQTP